MARWWLLVLALSAPASADVSYDFVGGPLVLGTKSTSNAGMQFRAPPADNDWHAHLGGGAGVRLHDLSDSTGFDLELSWDRFAWHEVDYDFDDVHQWRFTALTWSEYRYGPDLFTISGGAGLELLSGTVRVPREFDGLPDGSYPASGKAFGPVGTLRVSYLHSVGRRAIGLELVGTGARAWAVSGKDRPGIEFGSLDLQLRVVVRI